MNKDTFQNISNQIKDIFDTPFTFDVDCINVPHYDDAGFTFESGETKKGKTIKTCVLFVDIRNSVAMNNKYSKEIMGKIYTSFITSTLRCAEYYNGDVRNIIGDRVMIVFPPKDCFENAVFCAYAINSIALYIMIKHVKEFKCGIGIDYGEMKVHKTGIIKQGDKAHEYKSLIWIGRPANIASRLTDVANKEIEKPYFRIVYKPINYIFNPNFPFEIDFSYPKINPNKPYQDKEEKKYLTIEEFSEMFRVNQRGEIYINIGKLVSFEKEIKKVCNEKILITKEVYEGFVKACPNSNTVKKGYFTKQKEIKIKDYDGEIYGNNIILNPINEIK